MKKLFTLLFLCFSLFYAKSQNCVASFYPYVISGSDTVSFYDYSYNNDSTPINVSSWSWSFGDNTFASTQNPIHVYAGPGTYYVCLTITTTSSCSSTYCDSVVVTGTSSGCTAYFTSYPDTSCSTCYSFYDGSTGSGLSYSWNFGDNTSSTNQFPYHQYNTTGTYYVCLTISNGSGCSDTYCDSVSVGVSPPNCYASFYAAPDTSGSALVYNFYDYSYGNPISWLWSFGDGTFSTSQNPAHTFQTAGTYTVCLTINTSNCTDTFCYVIAVAPISNCLLYVSYTTVPESYSGANNGSIDVTVNYGQAPFSYLWTNGATTQDLNNISEGYYNVSVTDSSGCSTYASIYVADSSNVYIPITTLSNIPVDTCLQFSYDTVYVYNLDIIDSSTIAVTWIFLEISTGTTAYLVDTFTITSQGYYSVSITISCSQKKSINVYTGYIYVDYNDISLSINNKIAESSMKLFPNPFNEVLNLQFNSSTSNQITVKLFDITGKSIFERNYNASKGLNNLIINTDMLGHGMYFVNIISGNQIFNKKIVK